MSDRVETFQRVEVPGTSEVSFDKAGDFTLYFEAFGVSGDEGASAVPSMEIGLEPAQGDTPVTLERYSGTATYKLSGHEGRALATFHVEPGTYLLTSTADAEPGSVQLAVGGGLGAGLVQLIVPGIILVIALIGAVVLAIVTAIRRSRSRIRSQTAFPPMYGHPAIG